MPALVAEPLPVTLRPILEVARDLGLAEDEIEPYGRYRAKIELFALERRHSRPPGRLVLMTGVSPTPAGEGKTTMSVGLAQGLNRLGCHCVAAIREPSQGPVFGLKGAGTGAGRSMIHPVADINLHFNGDLHAIAAANNLLAAMVDNHLQWGNPRGLDPRAITWKRCLDLNDRALRHIVTGLGGPAEGVPRETGFEITAASEVMAILALAGSVDDLKRRLARIVVGADTEGAPVTAGDLETAGAMAALLKDALKPNLVQTTEGTPAILHGGPFGNIAHGCSSVLGTRMALALGEVCVTEAGFGADLGAEKFCHIKMRQAGMAPDLAVLVATTRALKMHGGMPRDDLARENAAAVEAGFANLARHAENLAKFGLPVLVGINRFAADTPAELEALERLCRNQGLPVAVADVWSQGGAGALELGRCVLAALEKPATFRPLYPPGTPVRVQIETLAREVYRAGRIDFLPSALKSLAWIDRNGFGALPVCMAKTQYSFSDDPGLAGVPDGHTLTIRDLKLSAGAGFVVAYAGQIMTMPGLPRVPAAHRIDVLPDGTILGIA